MCRQSLELLGAQQSAWESARVLLLVMRLKTQLLLLTPVRTNGLLPQLHDHRGNQHTQVRPAKILLCRAITLSQALLLTDHPGGIARRRMRLK